MNGADTAQTQGTSRFLVAHLQDGRVSDRRATQINSLTTPEELHVDQAELDHKRFLLFTT
jgi:hypothetical protein